jgi:two-component system OmpR family sensor kinase
MLARLRGRVRLRTRVVVGVLVVTLAVLAAFDVAAVTALRQYLIGQTDTQLEEVLALYRPPGGFALRIQPSRQVRPQFVRAVRKGRQVELPLIIGPRILAQPPILDQYFVSYMTSRKRGWVFISLVHGNSDLSPGLPADLATLGTSSHFRTVTSSNGHAQLRLLALTTGGGTIVITTSLASVDRTLGQLQLIAVVGSAAAALLVALGIALVVRRGLRPIEEMAAEADRVTAGDLTERVGPQDPRTEVGRLGTALNGMLGRIEASVTERDAAQEANRRFFADASHELRTPLASLRANAELYQQGALPERGQVDEAMRRIVLESRRMGTLVDDMLRLAQLDQHPGQQRDRVDLTALVSDRVGQASRTDPCRTWQAHVETGLVTTGDEELLRRAIDNLLGNVRTHTPDGSTATVVAARHGRANTIEVSDDGPGVPADQRARIFDRFYRAAAPSRRPGAGLGLAIVAAIAAAHDGSAQATLNHPSGLRVTLTLSAPAATSAELAPATSAAATSAAAPELAPATSAAGTNGAAW